MSKPINQQQKNHDGAKRFISKFPKEIMVYNFTKIAYKSHIKMPAIWMYYFSMEQTQSADYQYHSQAVAYSRSPTHVSELWLNVSEHRHSVSD